MVRIPCVYLLTNYTNTVLYTGVTSNLVKRVWEHRSKATSGFSKRYHLYKLVYYECFDSMIDAITREKKIKGWTRTKKNHLIEQNNPHWKDLYEAIV